MEVLTVSITKAGNPERPLPYRCSNVHVSDNIKVKNRQ